MRVFFSCPCLACFLKRVKFLSIFDTRLKTVAMLVIVHALSVSLLRVLVKSIASRLGYNSHLSYKKTKDLDFLAPYFSSFLSQCKQLAPSLKKIKCHPFQSPQIFFPATLSLWYSLFSISLPQERVTCELINNQQHYLSFCAPPL